eukprot:2269697-Rhodomonas_salina.3
MAHWQPEVWQPESLTGTEPEAAERRPAAGADTEQPEALVVQVQVPRPGVLSESRSREPCQ